MKTKKFQLGIAALAAAGFVALPWTALAQKPPGAHPDRPPQRQPAPPQRPPLPHATPVHPQNNNANANRPPNATPPAHSQGAVNGAGVPNGNNGNIPRNNFNNEFPARNGTGASFAPRLGVGGGSARPWVDTMRSLSPGQRENVLRNSKAFQNLSPEKQNKIRQQFNQWDRMTPQQRVDLQAKEHNWIGLSQPQRDHLKNDVLPRLGQLPWDRQQVINQKLGVLQHMPESARNQRLNDPNFTRGMSDEEKSVLHDLSHTHVGGVPEPPSQ
jgi:hypothetical protein